MSREKYLSEILSELTSDEEKLALLDLPKYANAGSKALVARSITNGEKKLELLEQIKNPTRRALVIISLPPEERYDEKKLELIHSPDFHRYAEYVLYCTYDSVVPMTEALKSLSDQMKFELIKSGRIFNFISDKLPPLKFREIDRIEEVANVAKSIKSTEIKEELLNSELDLQVENAILLSLPEEIREEKIKIRKQELKERVHEALKKTKDLQIGGKSYLYSMVLQRIEGPENSGSSYSMTPEELLEKLYEADWEEVKVPEPMSGCTYLKSNIPGLNGIVSIYNLPEDTELYAIDPKGTGTIGIGAAGVEKTPEEDTYMILGMEDGVEVVFTFHPGKPVSPSMVKTNDYPHGSKITIEEAKRLGFRKVKFITDEMKKEFDENDVHQKIKEKSDDFEI